MAKEKGEWKSTTIAEWQNSDSSTWKAQQSTSPDGKKFVGIRQYIKTKNGEIAGKGGITFLDDAKAQDSLIAAAGLLMEAANASKGADGKKGVNVKALKSGIKHPPVKKSAKNRYVLYREDTEKFFKGLEDEKVKVVSSLDKAEQMKDADAEFMLTNLSSKWKKRRVTDFE